MKDLYKLIPMLLLVTSFAAALTFAKTSSYSYVVIAVTVSDLPESSLHYVRARHCEAAKRAIDPEQNKITQCITINDVRILDALKSIHANEKHNDEKPN